MFAHAAALTAAAAAEAPAPLGPRGDTGPGTRAFPDPGSGPRSDARALLAYARESVADAAAEAAAVLRDIAPAPADGASTTALASVGNALLERPDALQQIVGGAALMAGGAALFGGGLAADVTVAGATVGVPANVAGAALVASGAALAGAGIMNAAAHAAGDSGVSSPSSREDRADGRDVKGRFTGRGGRPWVDKEKLGIAMFEAERGVKMISQKVRALVDGGNPHRRYFDGLFRNPDGTYSALEVKSGTGGLTREQRLFDGLINGGSPARSILNGQEISIVRVFTRTVD